MAKERARGSAPPVSRSLYQRDPSDPTRRVVELAQRGRMILDVAETDFETAEARLGPFHSTTWYFRTARDEARNAWDRLRVEYGTEMLEAAMVEPPVALLEIPGPEKKRPAALLFSIQGQTYNAQRVIGSPLAPLQWRLARLRPPLEHGPYYICRLRGGAVQCDCAEWIYRSAETPKPTPCKHLLALRALGWI